MASLTFSLRTAVFSLFLLGVLPGLSGYGLGAWIHSYRAQIPEFKSFKAKFKISDSVLYARDGRILNRLRLDLNSRTIMWTQLEEVNSDFVNGLIAKEDHRFFHHQGVDYRSWPRVIAEGLVEGRWRGASTLTMQLAKMIFHIKTRTIYGKLQQIFYAWALEEKWSKEKILEAYLSLVPLRGDILGVGTAAFLILQKSPLYLTPIEQKLLLKLINQPSLAGPELRNQICESKVELMERSSCNREFTGLESRLNSRATSTGPTAIQSLAGHFHQRLLSAQREASAHSANIFSNVDYDLQLLAMESIHNHLQQLKEHHVQDAAVLVLDNERGGVLAYVGSSGFDHSQAPFVDMVKAPRQLGSTVKPFLYAAALERKLITLGSWIEDSPVEIFFANGSYHPSNHDRVYHGWVHPAAALASSLNVPAIKVIQLLGVEEFWRVLKALEFTVDREPDYYGPALALGVIEGSLWQLTHAYQKLATGKKAADGTPLFSRPTLQRISWILSHGPHRALSFGQDSLLNVPEGFVAKTGTSKDMRDNWCMGYNHKFTVGVWVGNADATSMRNVLGVTGAAPIWRVVVDHLLKQGISQRVGPVEVLSNAPLSQERSEFLDPEVSLQFQAEEAAAAPVKSNQNSRIRSPGPSSIYAIDPGIPRPLQKILLIAEGPQQGLQWRINGKIISDQKWTPEPGWKKVELFRGPEKLDESIFLVK